MFFGLPHRKIFQAQISYMQDPFFCLCKVTVDASPHISAIHPIRRPALNCQQSRHHCKRSKKSSSVRCMCMLRSVFAFMLLPLQRSTSCLPPPLGHRPFKTGHRHASAVSSHLLSLPHCSSAPHMPLLPSASKLPGTMSSQLCLCQDVFVTFCPSLHPDISSSYCHCLLPL